jgi:hypothetical protein
LRKQPLLKGTSGGLASIGIHLFRGYSPNVGAIAMDARGRECQQEPGKTRVDESRRITALF